MKKAIVIGATGLVGSNLVKQLLSDSRFNEVLVFTRRETGLKNTKLQERIIDFDKPENWRHLVKGDVLFSALGTTLAKAGSKESQYKIDFTYQFRFAEAAAFNGVNKFVLVSSSGANPNSLIFYSRMKGELEEAVKKLNFEQIHVIQPGLLAGDREEKRTGEEIGYVILNGLSKIPGLGKYKPIQGSTVAAAMINAALSQGKGVKMYALEEVFGLAEKSINNKPEV